MPCEQRAGRDHSVLQLKPLIDLGFLLLSALFAFVFREGCRRFEELATHAIEKRKAL